MDDQKPDAIQPVAPRQPDEPQPAIAEEPQTDAPRLTREDKIIYWTVAIALLILTPLILYIAFRARTSL